MFHETLGGCSLEHATNELKADPEFLAAKSWHKAKVETSLWSFERLVLESSYLFSNYLFLKNFQHATVIDYKMDVSGSLEVAFVIRTCQLSQQMNLKIQPLGACPFLLRMVGIYSTNPGWC